MITAEIANSYNRDVFAVPGKITDSKSEGCNHLIKTNSAAMFTDAAEFLEVMGWQAKTGKPRQSQKQLFVQLSEDEEKILELLREREMHIDELNLKSGMNMSAVAAALLNLELNGIIRVLPGKVYKLS